MNTKKNSDRLPDRPSTRWPHRQRGRVLPIAIVVLLILIALPAVWAWMTLSYAYSEGERAGVLQKFSRKGWLCKTYEGELAQYVVGGVAPQIWTFSTRDPKVAQELFKAVGQQVQVHYTEHRGLPTSCFAETNYFAESFRVVSR